MQSLGLLIHNASTQLKREFERVARPYGLTLLQWRVLKHLSLEDGLTQTVLGTRLEVSPMTISDVIERLEAAGLVAREVDPQDSRAKIVRITSPGLLLTEKMRATASEVYERALDGIDEADRTAMERALTKIASNLEDAKTRKDKVA